MLSIITLVPPPCHAILPELLEVVVVDLNPVPLEGPRAKDEPRLVHWDPQGLQTPMVPLQVEAEGSDGQNHTQEHQGQGLHLF